MNRILAATGLWLLVIVSYAQTPRADSLKREFVRLKTQPSAPLRDSLLVDVLNQLIPFIHGTGNQGPFWLDSMRIYSKQINSLRGLWLYDIWWGNHLALIGNYKEGAAQLMRAAQGLEHAGYIADAIFAYLRLGSIGAYMHQERMGSVEPVVYFQKALTLAKSNGLSGEAIRTLLYIGDYYIAQKNYQAVIRSELEAEQLILAKSRPRRGYPSVLINLGTAYLHLDQEKQGLSYLERALREFRTMAHLHPPLTINYFNWEAMYQTASYYIRKGRLDEAIKQANLAEKELLLWSSTDTTSADVIKYRVENLTVLYEAYKRKGNYQKALFYSEQIQQIKEKSIKAELDKQYNELNKKFDTEQKNAQIIRLENDKLLNAQQQDKLLRYSLIGLLVLLVLVVGFVVWSNQRLRAKNREISESLLRGQTTERSRIAAQLHDNLGSTLTAMRFGFLALDPHTLTEAEQTVYRHLQRTVEDAYDEVRTLSHNLIPKTLEEKGLWAALGRLVDNLNYSTPVQFTLVVPTDEGLPDKRASFELYSIVLELTTNILKHAQATEAQIVVSRQNRQLHLRIIDDGIGLQADAKAEGAGLQSVRQRVDALKGTIQFMTQTPAGTQILIDVPVGLEQAVFGSKNA